MSVWVWARQHRWEDPNRWEDPTWPTLILAWGLAGLLLVGLKAWAAVVRRRWRADLRGRPWWLAMAAGVADVGLFVGVVYAIEVATGRAGDRRGRYDGERLLAGIVVEAVIHLGWAVLLTRRARGDESGG